jgi:hypothetical protein
MKVSPSDKKPSSITMKTRPNKDASQVLPWWKATSDKELGAQVLTSAAFLKESQQSRYRQAAIFARLYGNVSLFNFVGSSFSKIDAQNALPTDRPTFNLVQSATDTLISRISQSRPSPVFLTDNSDYKERNLAKKLNNFIQGEFYQTKAYEKAPIILRDALVEGTGCLKVYTTQDKKVGLERVLLTELLIDPNEAIYGDPRQLYQLKLIDRAVLAEQCPGVMKNIIATAAKATVDNSADASKTVSDLVMVVEGWHLPSGKDAKDGRHVIACSSGVLLDEPYTKDKFPFVFLHYSPRLLGFWAQGLAEQLMGTQMEINSLLFTITKAIKLVGVPRVFVESGSKVLKSSFNNDIGSIITFQGTKPSYEVAQCVPQELYAQLQRLIDYGYQQCGVSSMQASAQKPAGLNSGEAIRSYDDISTDRFASLSRRYDTLFVDLAYQIIDLAKDITEQEGKYMTVFPNKNGVKEIDLRKADLVNDTFVIQCFNMSSLPKDPAGRMQKITEMIQSGMITIKEGRRLLDYPDLDQVEKLANASEERILQILDEVVNDGKYTPPDPFMNLELANELVVQYINLYTGAKLEEDRCEMLRAFFNQIQDLVKAAAPPPVPGIPGAPTAAAPTPQAVPEAPPVSPILPNAPASQ